MKFYGVELKDSELKNLRIEFLDNAPSSAEEGRFYYNNTEDVLYLRCKGGWKDIFKGAVGDGLQKSNGAHGTLSVKLDGATLSVSAAGLKVAAGGVNTTQLADASVTTVKIVDGNVTFAKLANAAVETSVEGMTLTDTAIPTSQAVKTVTDALNTAITGETSRAGTAEGLLADRLTVIEGADTVAGSIAKAVKDEATLRTSGDAALQTQIDNVYTKAQTDSNISAAVTNLVDSAPSTLNTLNELAAALGDDANFATTIATTIGNETTRATGVESALSSRIDSIENGSLNEEAVQDLVGAMVTDTNSIDMTYTDATGVITADVKLDGTTLTTTASGVKVADAVITRISTAESDIDALETGLANVYTKAQTDSNISSAVSGLVASAPEALNTLKELADALGSDANFATTIATTIGNEATRATAAEVALSGRIDSIESGSLNAEAIQDIVGAMATDSGTLDFTYDDGAGTFTAIVKADSIDSTMINADVAGNGLAQNVNGSLEISSVVLGRITTAESDIDALESADTALAARVTTAESDIDALQTADTALGTRVTTAESDIDALQTADTALAVRVTTAESDIDALELADTALAARVTTAESDIDTLQTGLTNVYTKAETDTNISTAVSNLIDSAPETLNTLNELAAALGDDANFATTIATTIGNETTRATGAESALSSRIDSIESGTLNSEAVQDIVGAMVLDTNTIDLTYDDTANKFTADVKANSISATHLTVDSVTTAKILDNNITFAKLADAAIETSVEGMTLTNTAIPTSQAVKTVTDALAIRVTTAESDIDTLQSDVITLDGRLDAIEGGSLNAEAVQDIVGAMTVDSDTLDFSYNDGANTLTAIVKDASITTAKIAGSAITTALIADANVTTDKLANDSVTADKLAHNLDATAIGFNAAKVAGKHVNDTETTSSNLWSAERIHNAIVDQLNGQTWQKPVIDWAIATPPATPSEGDRYVVNSLIYPIVSTTASTKVIKIAGDHVANFAAADTIKVKGQVTAGVNGQFTVASVSLVSGATEIVVNETVVDSTGEATVHYATGAWAPYGPDEIVEYINSAWVNQTEGAGAPNKGWATKVTTDSNLEIVFNGLSWVDLPGTTSHNGLSDLQGGTANNHYHLTLTQHTDLTDGGTSALHKHDVDADSVTVSNLVVANLKTGVLDTDLSTTSANDDTIPSAKAVKTYVDSLTGSGASDLTAHTADTSTHGVTGAIVGTTDAQALSNKIIDAAANTISNLNTTHLASGVLDTDLSVVAETDTTLPSAKAVKTYVDTSIASHKFAGNIGNDTDTSFVVTHNLGTRDIIVQVRDVSSPFAMLVPAEIKMTTANTVTIEFPIIPTVDQFRVVVLS